MLARVSCHSDSESEALSIILYDIMKTESIAMKFTKTKKVFYFSFWNAETSNSNKNFVLTLYSLQNGLWIGIIQCLIALHEYSLSLFVYTKNGDGLSLSKLIAAVLTEKMFSSNLLTCQK